eukprot:c43526_g1_i1 orf=2-181(-)
MLYDSKSIHIPWKHTKCCMCIPQKCITQVCHKLSHSIKTKHSPYTFEKCYLIALESGYNS